MLFTIQTLGCKVNQHESQQMRETLIRSGMRYAEKGEKVDLHIINSCTVTATADQKTRQMLHRARRDNPDAIICLTGCVPQAFPDRAETLLDADIVMGNSNREYLLDAISAYMERRERIVAIAPHDEKSGLGGCIARFGERTRSYIKIEDGCNRFCAYCIIPYARGRVRSRALDDIVAEARMLAQDYREVVLVGINLSAYGMGTDLSLIDVVKAVAEVDGIERIRLGSIEPDLLTDQMLRYLASEPKFCPQFHMSIQSGCDATLARMKRRYDTSYYADLVARIREYFDNPAITTDIMVGFPGETQEEFEQSLAFAESIGFAKAHCFSYSRREGTVAYDMPNQVSPEDKNLRSDRMISAMRKSGEQFNLSQIGKTAQVLVEREVAEGVFEGYTENYTPVYIKQPCKKGEIVSVTLTAIDGEHCIGVR